MPARKPPTSTSASETFDERLLRLRTDRGLSVVELASAIGSSEGTIRQIESGKREVAKLCFGPATRRHVERRSSLPRARARRVDDRAVRADRTQVDCVGATRGMEAFAARLKRLREAQGLSVRRSPTKWAFPRARSASSRSGTS